MKRVVRIVIAVISATVLIYSLWRISDYLLERKSAADYNHALSDSVVTLESVPPDALLEKAPISVDFEALTNDCENIRGWLYCADTVINYPVVQSEDNSYYLHRLPDGSYSDNGSLFLDYRNSADMSDFCSIIYGHNLKLGGMFGSLDEYKDQDYYDRHPVMYLLTPTANYKLEICAGYLADATSTTYNIERTPGDKQLFLAEARTGSYFEPQFEFGLEDSFILLSTCDYSYNNSRLVLLAKKIPCD